MLRNNDHTIPTSIPTKYGARIGQLVIFREIFRNDEFITFIFYAVRVRVLEIKSGTET